MTCLGCREPIDDLVHLLKEPRTRGSLGTRSLGHQPALAVELVMDLGGPVGSAAMASGAVPGLCPHSLSAKSRTVLDT